MSDITLRKYQIGDEKGLTLLAKTVWGTHFKEDYWKWKYLDNPLRDSFSYLASYNDTIVGFVGVIPWRLIVMGKEMIGAQYTDVMVHPAWRRKGIFFPINRKTRDEAMTRTGLHYGFTNPTSTKIWTKRFRWESFQSQKLQKIINIKLLLRQGLKQRKGITFNRLGIIFSKLLSPKMIFSTKNDKALRTKFGIRSLDQFDARFDELWEKVRAGLNIATVRDSQYLNWRYMRNPEFRYTVFMAEENGTLSGFVVLRCEKKEGIMRGLIIDILVDPNQEMTASALISESIKFFRSQQVGAINVWMFEHNPIYGFLRKNGFSPKSTDNVVISIKSYSADISSNYVRDPRNWYLTMGDCEVF